MPKTKSKPKHAKGVQRIHEMIATMLRAADRHYENTGKPEKSMRVRRAYINRTGEIPTHEQAVETLALLRTVE